MTLTIQRPTPTEDPDTGDSIAFFRIYRDGMQVKDRYDRWYGGGASTTWQDIHTGGRHTRTTSQRSIPTMGSRPWSGR